MEPFISKYFIGAGAGAFYLPFISAKLELGVVDYNLFLELFLELNIFWVTHIIMISHIMISFMKSGIIPTIVLYNSSLHKYFRLDSPLQYKMTITKGIIILFRHGLVPDIFNSLAEKMNFTYSLQPSRDGMWGNIDEVSNGYHLQLHSSN